MDCTLIEDKLVAYHFGTASDAERDAIDEHLIACGACVRRYLQLKHQLDLEGRVPKPTSRLRARLRADVEAEFRPRGVRRMRSWLEQPISRGRGIAGAVALSMAASALFALIPARARSPNPSAQFATTNVVPTPPGRATSINTRIDSARTFADNRSEY